MNKWENKADPGVFVLLAVLALFTLLFNGFLGHAFLMYVLGYRNPSGYVLTADSVLLPLTFLLLWIPIAVVIRSIGQPLPHINALIVYHGSQREHHEQELVGLRTMRAEAKMALDDRHKKLMKFLEPVKPLQSDESVNT